MTPVKRAVDNLLEYFRLSHGDELPRVEEALTDVVRALRLFVLPPRGRTTHTQRIAHRAAWELLQAIEDIRTTMFAREVDDEPTLEPVVRALRALGTLIDVCSMAVMG
jgi:hypothetical protein